jgi:antitoxin component HigA of HigAB toxin-antitoxin module
VDPLERCAQLIQQRRTTTYLTVKKVLVSEYGEHEFERVKAYITEMLANAEEATHLATMEPEPEIEPDHMNQRGSTMRGSIAGAGGGPGKTRQV